MWKPNPFLHYWRLLYFHFKFNHSISFELNGPVVNLVDSTLWVINYDSSGEIQNYRLWKLEIENKSKKTNNQSKISRVTFKSYNLSDLSNFAWTFRFSRLYPEVLKDCWRDRTHVFQILCIRHMWSYFFLIWNNSRQFHRIQIRVRIFKSWWEIRPQKFTSPRISLS